MTGSSLGAWAGIALYLGLLGFWGERLLRRLDLPDQTLITRLPVGLALGLCVQLVAVNALSYALAPPLSFVVAFPLQAFSIVFLLRPASRSRPVPPVPRRVLALYAGMAGLVVLGFGARAFEEFQLDNFRQHWLNVATLLEGNFPVRHPFQPTDPVRYHYGANLLSAELVWLAGAPLFWTPQLLKTALVASFLLHVFGWVHERGGGAIGALLSVWAFALFVGLPELLTSLWQGPGPGGWIEAWLGAARQNRFFHFPAAALFVASVPFGYAISLAALDLLCRRAGRLDAASGACWVVLVAALALCATPEFAVLVGGLGLFLAWGELARLGQPPRRVRWELAAWLLAALALAAVQGGVLTDLWRSPAADAPATYGLRWPPGLASADGRGVYALGTPAWWVELALAPDGLALLLPLGLWGAWRRPSLPARLLLSLVAAGFALSHGLHYAPSPFNTNRFLAFALQLNLLLVCGLAAEWRAAGALRGGGARAGLAVAGVLLALGSLPALTAQAVGVGRALGWARDDGLPSYLAWWDDEELLRAAAWVATVTPPGAWIATNEPALLVARSGRFAPTSSVVTHGHARPGGLPSDYSLWTPEALLRSGVGHVCLFRSPRFQAADVDLPALRRELATPDAGRDALLPLLPDPRALLEDDSPLDAAAQLNAIVEWRPRFAARLDPERVPLDDATRQRLGRALRQPAGWMFVNRALLQALFPGGLAPSRLLSESLGDPHLARYPWVEALERRGEALAWRSPDFAPDRVRCAPLATAP